MLPPINHSVELCGPNLRVIPLGEQKMGYLCTYSHQLQWDLGVRGKEASVLWHIQPTNSTTEILQAIRIQPSELL